MRKLGPWVFGAWVLWSLNNPGGTGQYWSRLEAFETKEECEIAMGATLDRLGNEGWQVSKKRAFASKWGGLKRREDGASVDAGNQFIRFQCWPDTVDPRR